MGPGGRVRCRCGSSPTSCAATTATLPEDPAEVAIGKRVEVCFVPFDDTMALPQFRLSDEPPEHAPWRAPIDQPG